MTGQNGLPDIDGVAVDTATLDALAQYEGLIARWNPRINLVSKATLNDVWDRHIVDSAQIFEYGTRQASRWADLGSGGGFPGIVIALLARQFAPGREHILVESDQRKAAFLREAIRETGAPARVIAERIEAIAPLAADIVSARALAPLPLLLGFVARHLTPDGQALLPKGSSYESELISARESWDFQAESFTSSTDAAARILRISGLQRGPQTGS